MPSCTCCEGLVRYVCTGSYLAADGRVSNLPSASHSDHSHVPLFPVLGRPPRVAFPIASRSFRCDPHPSVPRTHAGVAPARSDPLLAPSRSRVSAEHVFPSPSFLWVRTVSPLRDAFASHRPSFSAFVGPLPSSLRSQTLLLASFLLLFFSHVATRDAHVPRAPRLGSVQVFREEGWVPAGHFAPRAAEDGPGTNGMPLRGRGAGREEGEGIPGVNP